MGGLSDAFKSIGLSGGAGGALAAINPTAILGTMASGALDFAGAMWQNSQNKKAATTAWNRQLAMLEYQNAYNTPAEQMKRYKEAGLNPNLIYGQQNLSASASSVPMAASAPSTGLGKGVDRTFAALRLGQDLQLGQAQIDQVKANTALAKVSALRAGADASTVMYNLGLARQRGIPTNVNMYNLLGSVANWFGMKLGDTIAEADEDFKNFIPPVKWE